MEQGPPQLVELVPQDVVSRRALGIAMIGLLTAFVAWTLVCAGSAVLDDFFRQPMLSLVSVVGAVGFGVPYVLVVLWLDRNEKEPLYLILATLTWGALVATVLALFSEAWMPGLPSPVIEEICKAAALYCVYALFRHHLDNVLDGVVYGALIGLGFAVFENFIYYMETGQVGTALTLVCARGLITAPGSHACFTAIAGVGVGLFRVEKRSRRWAFPPVALGAAIGVHLLWNGVYHTVATALSADIGFFVLVLPFAVLGLQIPFVVLVLIAATLALRHEEELIGRFLATEAFPVLHPVELDYLLPARRRSLRSGLLVMQGHFREYLLVRQRNGLLVQLAFAKWHQDTEVDGPAAELEHQTLVEGLRQALSSLPAPPA